MSETVPVDAGWGSRARDQKGWLSDRTLSGVPGVVYQGRVAEASDMVDGIVPPNEKPKRGATGNPLGHRSGEIYGKL